MKRLFLLIFILLANFSFAHPSFSLTQEQWFIQIGAFTSVENAVDFQANAQSKIENNYASERKFGHFVSIHPREENYRVLLGPYPSRADAQTTQQELAEIFSNSMVIKFATDTYSNYQYGYKFTWNEIDKSSYQKLQESSLATLNLDNFISPSLNNKVSLIVHTNQIHEEIFDFSKAKQLLRAKNIIFLQDEAEDYVIRGFVVNGKERLAEWSPVFYAYYPTEDLIVFRVMENYISFDTQAGDWARGKMPYYTLYLPNREFRITGTDFDPFGYGRSYIEVYNQQTKRYIELIDLGIVSPWYIEAGVYGLAWLSNNEVIFNLIQRENSKTETRYYRVTIDRIPSID